MKVIIIEDEMLSAEHLSLMLSKIDSSIEIVSIYDSIKSSVAAFKQGVKADLLFVDIHLADGLSFEIFSKVTIDIPIIFTTAYDEYAIQAFKLNSVDYLLKPIGIADLKAALDKYKKYNKTQQQLTIENIADLYKNISKPYKNRFMVKSGEHILSIKTEDILYFISENGLVLIASNQPRRNSIDYSLDEIEEMVSPEQFFRINRKVIININAIKKVTTYFNSRLKVISDNLDEEDGIVSRDRVSDFKAWMDK